MDIDEVIDSSTLSVEAQVAFLLGDEDADELASETPRWVSGGTVARRTERDRMSFDTTPQPNQRLETET